MKDVELVEVPVIGEVYLAHHAQVLDRQDGDLPLAQLVKADAAGKDRHAEIAADQVFDRRHIVDLEDDVKIVDAHVVALKVGDEEVAGVRVRQAEDHALLLELVESDHAAAGKGVVRRDGEDKIVRIEQEIVNAWVGHTPLDDGEIQLVGLEHCIKIIY